MYPQLSPLTEGSHVDYRSAAAMYPEPYGIHYPILSTGEAGSAAPPTGYYLSSPAGQAVPAAPYVYVFSDPRARGPYQPTGHHQPASSDQIRHAAPSPATSTRPAAPTTSRPAALTAASVYNYDSPARLPPYRLYTAATVTEISDDGSGIRPSGGGSYPQSPAPSSGSGIKPSGGGYPQSSAPGSGYPQSPASGSGYPQSPASGYPPSPAPSSGSGIRPSGGGHAQSPAPSSGSGIRHTPSPGSGHPSSPAPSSGSGIRQTPSGGSGIGYAPSGSGTPTVVLTGSGGGVGYPQTAAPTAASPKTLFATIMNNDVNQAEQLLRSGLYSPNVVDEFGQFPLHVACDSSALDPLPIIQTLVRHRANPNSIDAHGWTPLHSAAAQGRANICAYLLSLPDIEVDRRTNEGFTPLMYLCKGHGVPDAQRQLIVALINQLVAKGADINAQNADRETPLHLAALGRSHDVAALLLARGADVNAATSCGDTALHYVVRAGDARFVELLLGYRPNLSARSLRSGKTAEEEARAFGFTPIVDMLARAASVQLLAQPATAEPTTSDRRRSPGPRTADLPPPHRPPRRSPSPSRSEPGQAAPISIVAPATALPPASSPGPLPTASPTVTVVPPAPAATTPLQAPARPAVRIRRFDPTIGRSRSPEKGAPAAAAAASASTTAAAAPVGKFEDFYVRGKQLGIGAFATVYECEEKATGAKYAAKVISRTLLTADNMLALRREIEILRRVSHPNIVTLKALYESEQEICLVMELVAGGELFDRIKLLSKYTEDDARTLLRNICRAIAYLHERGIVHRDLKPENLLLENATDHTAVKVADFGLARYFEEGAVMRTTCGTPAYIAPEMLEGTSYGPSVDMWAIGMIAYILLTGTPPFAMTPIARLMFQILNSDIPFPVEKWGSLSADSKDFVLALLNRDTAQRLTASQALEHPWLREQKRTPSAELSIAEQLTRFQFARHSLFGSHTALPGLTSSS